MSLIWKTITEENYFFCSFIPVGWNNKSKARNGREVGSGRV
jgi:hypothetical protein